MELVSSKQEKEGTQVWLSAVLKVPSKPPEKLPINPMTQGRVWMGLRMLHVRAQVQLELTGLKIDLRGAEDWQRELLSHRDEISITQNHSNHRGWHSLSGQPLPRLQDLPSKKKSSSC